MRITIQFLLPPAFFHLTFFMKKILIVILAGLFTTLHLSAQYITIPDSAFATWLQNNGYGECMAGNQIDTNCTLVLNTHSIKCFAQPIRSLSGIQYFKNLDSLDCSNDSLNSISSLPGKLSFLNCSYNKLSALPALPSTLQILWCTNNKFSTLTLSENITDLECSGNPLSGLPTLPGGLGKLVCTDAGLNSLPLLSSGLKTLQCDRNSLHSLPALPPGLQILSCTYNSLSALPALPSTLANLNCQNNQLSSLPALPSGLSFLMCGYNQIDSLPAVPGSLKQLDCTGNVLTKLPSLPSSLTSLYCGRNLLDSLPSLSASLQKLYCDHNHLTSMASLPAGLTILYCSNNSLTALPAIPSSVSNLLCDHNNLGALPELPDSLNILQCNFNTSLYCLPQLKKINTLNFDHTNVTCLPDYGSVSNSFPALHSIPLCGEEGHSSCNAFWNISGRVYFDANNNCVMDAGDSAQSNVKVMLYDGNSLLAQVYSGGDGYYSFPMKTHGTYYIVVDTAVLPFRVSCPGNGSRTVVISSTDSLIYSQDFALTCRSTGFDLGVSSIMNGHNVPRPGAIVPINTIAGDISKTLGGNCSTGVGGQVQLILSGPAKYVGGLDHSLSPSNIEGDTITWTVSNFGALNNRQAFGINVIIDTLAQAGSQICVTVNLTPGTAGDYNTSNNTQSYCFSVVNSLDPNTKEVFPIGDTISAQTWLTYTVRFQNTGNAIAKNIVVLDTLDSHLDANSFQVLGSSNPYTVQLVNNVVNFTFASINLPDSVVDKSGSHGYVQYKVLPKAGNVPGSRIENTAYIYFDYNAPVATNTTISKMAAAATAVAEVAGSNMVELNLFPNPASHAVTVKTDNTAVGGTLLLMNTTGQLVSEQEIRNTQITLPVSALANGVYFIKVTNSKGHFNMKKLIIQR